MDNYLEWISQTTDYFQSLLGLQAQIKLLDY